MRFDWVFLDAGNTLVTIDFDYLRELLQANGHSTGEPELARSELTARRTVDQAHVVRGTSDRTRWMPFFEMLLAGAGVRDAGLCARLLPVLEARQRSHNLWRRIPPEVPPALAALKAAGYRLAVISNSDGRLENLLRDIKLVDPFEFVIDSGKVGCEKPDPQIFRIALERAGIGPDRAVYCGDLYHVDVLGARSAGIEAVLLDPASAHTGAPCPRIASLSELPTLLDRWPERSSHA